MQLKYLISLSTLLLPIGMAHAQSAAPEATPAPGPSAASEAQPADSTPAPSAGASGQTGTVQAVPATDADLVKGEVVNDPTGQPVGTIESTTSAGVVLAVGSQKIQIPKNAVGKKDGGLVTTVTRAQLEAAASKSASNKGS